MVFQNLYKTLLQFLAHKYLQEDNKMIYNFENTQYQINNMIMIKVKSLKNCRAKLYKFEAINDKYSLRLTTAKSDTSISLYIPSFVSQMYSAKPLIENDEIEYVETTFDDNIIGNDLQISSNAVKLFTNGFVITNPSIKIHPSYFRSRIAGLAFF